MTTKTSHAGMAAMITAIAGLVTALGGLYLSNSSDEKSQLTTESTYNVTMEQLMQLKAEVGALRGELSVVRELTMARLQTGGHGVGHGAAPERPAPPDPASSGGVFEGDTQVEVDAPSPLGFSAIQRFVQTKNAPVKSVGELSEQPAEPTNP